MKKVPDKLIHVFEVLVILAVVFGIIAGLEYIGIFNFSSLFSLNYSDGSDNVHILPYDNGSIYSALSEGKSTDTVSVESELSREHVEKMLLQVTSDENYYQELNVTVYDDDGKTLTTKATVSREDGEFDVSLYASNGLRYKRIVQEDDFVQISIYDDKGKETRTTLPKGGFDIQEDTGIIMTHDRFFSENSLFAEGEEAFSVAYSDFGTVLMFEFYTKLDEYQQTERYWLSLDYGVVIRAECYEGDNIVFLLETIALN